ncbi:uncharacterized protein BJ171DRAFT_272859 [Polychytrium aggregatum]|uniref:uncharacterized protein n=1 Tax=Polychytrium aggregatum TaxID=110093 RepID=UPI0022FF30DC|nr:uncharacterized protein BJ171DRAFT_272859 [Polychytrium aggregatum]KAI9193333.1 hypothetical protein BJ171DRAFT_272859 [Polychytrium aggregatum]
MSYQSPNLPFSVLQPSPQPSTIRSNLDQHEVAIGHWDMSPAVDHGRPSMCSPTPNMTPGTPPVMFSDEPENLRLSEHQQQQQKPGWVGTLLRKKSIANIDSALRSKFTAVKQHFHRSKSMDASAAGGLHEHHLSDADVPPVPKLPSHASPRPPSEKSVRRSPSAKSLKTQPSPAMSLGSIGHDHPVHSPSMPAAAGLGRTASAPPPELGLRRSFSMKRTQTIGAPHEAANVVTKIFRRKSLAPSDPLPGMPSPDGPEYQAYLEMLEQKRRQEEAFDSVLKNQDTIRVTLTPPMLLPSTGCEM